MTDAVKPDRSRIGRCSKRKGKVWEREVAALLRPVFGEHIARGWQSRNGREDCDVKGSPYWIECKHGQLVNLRAALKQAIADTDGRTPVVIAKDDRRDPVVVMRLDDWIKLVGQVEVVR